MEEPRVSPWFRSQLQTEFDGQIRLRWSPKKQRWVLERRVGRVKAAPRWVDPLDDRAIQARDHVQTIMEVTPGTVTPCPGCGRDLRLAYKQMAEAVCPRCRYTLRAVFFPLGEDLLQHLRWSDPDRGGLARVFAHVDEEQARLTQAKRNKFRREHEAIWKEDGLRLLGIPRFGYAGARPFSGTVLKGFTHATS